jgi:hypothetical protein
MSNSTVTTKVSAAFLATVLIAGIIGLMPSSFMTANAQTELENELDNYGKKSYGLNNDESSDDSSDESSDEAKDNDESSDDSSDESSDEAKDNDESSDEAKDNDESSDDSSDESSDEAKDNDESSDDSSDESSDEAKDNDNLVYGTNSYEKKAYGSEPVYGTNSYEKKAYGSEPVYGTNSYEKKAYGNNDYGTQYQSYGKDNSDKSKDSVSIKKVKCNNININVNGLELNVLQPVLSDPAIGAQALNEGQIGASSFGSGGGSYGGGQSGSDNDFKFVCINNNNNTVIGGGEPVPPVPPEDACLLCFEETTEEVRDAIDTFLAAQGDITVSPGIVIPESVNTYQQLCTWLAGEAPLILTQIQIDALIDGFVSASPGVDREDVADLVRCLIDADLIDVVPPEPPGDRTICHRSSGPNQQEQTLTGLSDNAANAHLTNHDGIGNGAGPDTEGPCPPT